VADGLIKVRAEWRQLLRPGILIVSGKGGTGKSTVAAALASAAAAAGASVLLAEVEGRAEIARTLGIAEPGYAIAPTGLGFDAISITPMDAVFDYLRRYYGIDRLGRPLLRSGGIEQIVQGAPGFRDLLVTGKIYELARARAGDPDAKDPVHDLVIVDAPPTGQLVPFLSAAETFASLVGVGPMKRRATNVAAMLRTRGRVAIVANAAEMSVAETLEAVPSVRDLGIEVAAIVVNRVAPEVYPRGLSRLGASMTPEQVAAVAGRSGLKLRSGDAQWLVDQAVDAARRRRSTTREINRLRAAARLLEFPEAVGAAPRIADLLAKTVMQREPDSAGERSGNAVRAPHPRTASAKVDSRHPAPHLATGSLEQAVTDARIVVVCGSGGVGKTTISAAIALHAAASGTRTVLLTVDPARRLATALRLPTTAGDRITIRVAPGRAMEVMQLDTRRTFDELVERFASEDAQRERIFGNRFYRRMADTLGGTHEYMAMEKLHQLADEEGHEAIVIDTPPTRSALSFLDAPKRLTDFLGGRFLRVMVRPAAAAGRLTLSAARLGARAMLRTVGRLVGAETLADTIEFLAAFEGLYGGFAERAKGVTELLSSNECAFVLVASPDTGSLAEASAFLERLRAGGMNAAAVVLNRFDPAPPDDGVTDPLEGAVAAIVRLENGDDQERAVAAILRSGAETGARRRAAFQTVAAFAAAEPAVALVPVPDLGPDVHDVRGLGRVAERLFVPNP
jgi:anion-transporting  ArsA/GET3 family ATPase